MSKIKYLESIVIDTIKMIVFFIRTPKQRQTIQYFGPISIQWLYRIYRKLSIITVKLYIFILGCMVSTMINGTYILIKIGLLPEHLASYIILKSKLPLCLILTGHVVV